MFMLNKLTKRCLEIHFVIPNVSALANGRAPHRKGFQSFITLFSPTCLCLH